MDISWVFVGCFVCFRGHFVECSPRYRNPSAAVGADLSCPHIRKHPRNGEWKRIFDNVKTRV
ncbi:hypothetical protein [Prevotella pallens]